MIGWSNSTTQSKAVFFNLFWAKVHFFFIEKSRGTPPARCYQMILCSGYRVSFSFPTAHLTISHGTLVCRGTVVEEHWSRGQKRVRKRDWPSPDSILVRKTPRPSRCGCGSLPASGSLSVSVKMRASPHGDELTYRWNRVPGRRTSRPSEFTCKYM